MPIRTNGFGAPMRNRSALPILQTIRKLLEDPLTRRELNLVGHEELALDFWELFHRST